MHSSDKIIRGDQAASLKKWNVDSHAYREMRGGPTTINGDPIDYDAIQRTIDLQKLQLEQRASEIELLKQMALKEASEHGYQTGYEEGKKQAHQERQTLVRLSASLSEEIEQLRDHLSEKIMTLAMNTARRVLINSIEAQPECVVHLLNEAVEALNQKIANFVIHAHASSIATLQAQFGNSAELSGIRLVEDRNLAAGGFRLVHPEGEVDLTLETRWKRVVGSLGRQDELTPPDTSNTDSPT